ncbi:MAG: helix-turn-helix domain-containing protein [Deltaproteobacteria bacterium]|nr:helix-turn-helix domain-containing protein [Deltaproteobacteria bacterium]
MSYTHLTQNERYVISHLKCAGFSLREIARRINRHHDGLAVRTCCGLAGGLAGLAGRCFLVGITIERHLDGM